MNLDLQQLRQKIEALETRLQEKTSALENAERMLVENSAQQQRTAAELAETAIIYRTTFDNAAVGIAHVTLGGRWLRINQFFCEMLGYSPEELQAKTFQEITHPDDLDADLKCHKDVLSGKIASYSMEKRYISKSGGVIWAHLSVSLVRDEAGHPKFFISVVKNIDRRVRANAEVEQSRARLKAVLDSLSEGVVVFSDDGKLLEANRAALQLFGYKKLDEIHSRAPELDELFDVRTFEGRKVPLRHWPVSRLLRGESVSGIELTVHRRDMNKTWIACFSGSVVNNSRQTAPLAVLTVQDITKRRMAETALRVSEERLRLAFDNIPDMVVIYDMELRIQYANLAAMESMGKSAAELIGRRDVDIAPQSVILLWRPLLHAALESVAIQSDDFDYPSSSGLRNLAVTCVPITESSGVVREILAICHDYTERRQAEEQVRQAALHDPLTGLPNRALMFEYARHIFAAANRHDQQVSVIFIDLDRFKPINDIHGHEVGDAVLRQIAKRLRQTIRGEDIVFRLGGDEFLALVPHANDANAGDKVARHLMDAINRSYQVGSLDLSLTCSIGISIYPRDGTEVDALVSHADAAMYLAKQMGRNNFQFYTAALAERVQAQSLIEQGIKSALTRHEFCLYYQPLVDMETSQVVSVEALLRWPKNGMTPDRFVQVAEATGLIGSLGEWVLSEACHQHTTWKNEGLPAIPIAVNVSPMQFRKKDFSADLEHVMNRHHINPAAIQIELTETAVMEDIDHAITILNHFRKKGIKISLDDFGTGYSSLNYLSRLPLDKIKVDKSFVHRLENDTASRAITEAIIALGRTLNLEIVAEGIESESVLQYLRTHGCHQAQGYHVCKPMQGNAFLAWYRAHTSPNVAGLH
ncbi:EAL and GGDEF domain-containing protein [Noviherbaspirillum saxi]|uniref:EAL domain-containing protein n=1 Tax=Noviherbaspirillum saxi TaxID=2320863 RepID=A0A3A3FMJ6_9BURK|nr:EAL domain-containing protein [Noviherbaspirillum saxi]RJF95951.1 EAL domain-containing protein [Noviherbaspirillum saxi]